MAGLNPSGGHFLNPLYILGTKCIKTSNPIVQQPEEKQESEKDV